MHCAVWDKSKDIISEAHKKRIALSDPIYPLPPLRTSTDHIRVVAITKRSTEESVYTNGRDAKGSEGVSC